MRKLAGIIFLSMSSLFGFNHICPGEFTVEGVYLYVKPDVGNTYFATNNSYYAVADNGADKELAAGKIVDNDLEYTSAFRVGAYYSFCECPIDIRGFYTRVSSNNTASVSPQNGLAPSALIPDDLESTGTGAVGNGTLITNVSSYLNLVFQRGDALIAHSLCSDWCGNWMNVFGGLEIIDINFDSLNSRSETINAVSNTAAVFNNNKVFGIGPEVGLESKFSLCRPGFCRRFVPECLTLVSKGSFSLMAVQNKLSLNEYGTFGNNDDDNPQSEPYSSEVNSGSNWGVIWSAYCQLGVAMEKRISCVNTSLEIGYEFDLYSQVLERQLRLSSLPVNNRTDFSLQSFLSSLSCGLFNPSCA